MQTYTRPDGFIVIPNETRKFFAIATPDAKTVIGRVRFDRDNYGLFTGEAFAADRNEDVDFRSASLAHAIDHIVRTYTFTGVVK